MRNDNESRPYVEHFIAEHRRVHGMLRQARARLANLAGPDPEAPFADIAQIFQRVREELAHHFTEEEGGGCLEEAVSYCPALSGEARRIEAEHADLLAKIDRLIAQATERSHGVENRVAMSNAFNDFCLELRSHERAENEVMRQGFGVNVNGDDNEPASALDA